MLYLKQLSDSISTLSSHYGIDYDELVKKASELTPHRYKIPTQCGEIWTEGIFKNDEFAVAKLTATADTMMEIHNHKEHEIMYVQKGKLILTLPNNEQVNIINVGELFVIRPNDQHSIYCPEETIMLALTIPASKTWPEGLTSGK